MWAPYRPVIGPICGVYRINPGTPSGRTVETPRPHSTGPDCVRIHVHTGTAPRITLTVRKHPHTPRYGRVWCGRYSPGPIQARPPLSGPISEKHRPGLLYRDGGTVPQLYDDTRPTVGGIIPARVLCGPPLWGPAMGPGWVVCVGVVHGPRVGLWAPHIYPHTAPLTVTGPPVYKHR